MDFPKIRSNARYKQFPEDDPAIRAAKLNYHTRKYKLLDLISWGLCHSDLPYILRWIRDNPHRWTDE
jgi:hypothetical protein